MDVPSFSVILPTYNRAFIITSAVESVLKQVYNKFELIIIDDGSTDQTEQIIKKTYNKELQSGKIKYIKNAHLGVCAARNIGLKIAKNDWIAYIDSDNIMFEEALGTFATFIRNNPQTLNFYGSMIAMSNKKIYGKAFNYEKLKENNFIDLGTYIHHKSLIDECGKFDETLKKYVDWDLILRQCYLHTPIFVNTAVLYYNDSIQFKRITTQERKAENFKKVQHNIEVFEKSHSKKYLETTPIQLKDTRLTSTATNHHVFFKIIIPNYNNISYIKKCLDSILNQTFQDFKIIIVDDLSTDTSDKVCAAYSRKFPDKIIYKQLKEKGYAGAARNYGLEYDIDCQYVWFVDSDDWLYSKNSLQIMYDAIVKTYPDILRCPYINYFSEKRKYTEILKTDIDSIIKNGAAPYKNCIKSKFQTCKFKEKRSKCNDVIWFLRLYDQVNLKNVVTLSQPVYVYNRGSVNSCQNNVLCRINLTNIQSELKLVDDLTEETFKTSYCKTAQIRITNNVQNLYKLIDTENLQHRSFVISINTKQYTQFCEIFKHSSLFLPMLKNGSTKKEFSNPRNCTESHISIIKYAKEHNWPYVFIFEDDAYPCKDLAINLQAYMSCIPKKAKLVLFGWSNVNKSCQSFSSPYNKITSVFFGSHSYVIFQNGYDELLNLYNRNPNGHYDRDILCRVSDSYVCHKPLFIQYSKTTSMNNHQGYILYGDHELPPNDFQDIQTLLTLH